MKDRPANASIFTLGLGFLALTLAAAFSPAPAHPAHPAARAAPSADLVLCDRLAADPPTRKARRHQRHAAIGPSDVPLALKYCKIAAPGIAPGAAPARPRFCGQSTNARRDLSHRKAADKGSTSAMVELGVLLANGTGVAKDQAQAHELFRRAADAGNPRGVVNLVALSSDGGPPIDPARPAACWRARRKTTRRKRNFSSG